MYSSEEEQATTNSTGNGFYRNNKVLVWAFILIILIAIIVVVVKKNSDSTSSRATVNKYSISIYPENDIILSPGNTSKLIAVVKDNSNAKVIWTSSDPSVATVDNGSVQAIKYGTVIITASYTHTDSKEYFAKKEIIVAEGKKDVAINDISIKDGNLAMPVNGTYSIVCEPTPSDAYIFNKTITSSNENVVTVSDTGLIQSVGEGEATITININDGAIVRTLKAIVSSSYTNSEIVANPTKVTLNKDIKPIKVGGTVKISYTVEPADASKAIINWNSSDTGVATVDKNGIVEAKGVGTTIITIEALNGVSDNIEIIVESDNVAVTDLQLPGDLYLEVGQNETVTPEVIPEDATDSTTVCTSNNPATVSVNSTGTSCVLTGISEGQAIITFKSNSSDVSKTVNVTVSTPVNDSGGGGGSCSNTKCSTQCPAGKYCSCGKCVSCPEGYYCGNNKKTACPDGKSSVPNSTSYQDCYVCSQGTYLNNKKCVSCPAGYTTKSSGATSKDACNVKLDSKCAQNQYEDANGNCQSCPSSHPNSAVGSKGIGSCYRSIPAGNQLLNGKLYTCGENTYSGVRELKYNQTTAVCTRCPNNSTTKGKTGSTSSTACVCNAGYYKDGTSCTICPQNNYCPGTNLKIYCGNNRYTTGKGKTSSNDCIRDIGLNRLQ